MPMEHLNSSAELYLPYNRAVTSYEAIEASADNLTDYPHPQRPSVVIAL